MFERLKDAVFQAFCNIMKKTKVQQPDPAAAFSNLEGLLVSTCAMVGLPSWLLMAARDVDAVRHAAHTDVTEIIFAMVAMQLRATEFRRFVDDDAVLPLPLTLIPRPVAVVGPGDDADADAESSTALVPGDPISGLAFQTLKIHPHEMFETVERGGTHLQRQLIMCVEQMHCANAEIAGAMASVMATPRGGITFKKPLLTQELISSHRELEALNHAVRHVRDGMAVGDIKCTGTKKAGDEEDLVDADAGPARLESSTRILKGPTGVYDKQLVACAHKISTVMLAMKAMSSPESTAFVKKIEVAVSKGNWASVMPLLKQSLTNRSLDRCRVRLLALATRRSSALR
jgi:hypothetical protein